MIMEKIALVFDKNTCMGCHSCEVACKQEHELGVGPRLVRVIEDSPDYIPVYCHHCAKAPCKDACPVEAIYRTDRGIVLIDNERCIGCRECVDACPFGAMQFDDQTDIAVKCDLCVQRLEQHLRPACMGVCPTGSVTFRSGKNIAAVFEKQ